METKGAFDDRKIEMERQGRVISPHQWNMLIN